MKFWQRVLNTLIVEAQKRLRDIFVFPRLDEIIEAKFPGRKRKLKLIGCMNLLTSRKN